MASIIYLAIRTGDSGTAKTVTIAKYLGNLDATKNVILNMNFSSRTTSMDVQRGVEAGAYTRPIFSST